MGRDLKLGLQLGYYEGVVRAVHELYIGGHKEAAAAKIPTDLVEQLALIGRKDKIRHDLEAWRDSIVATLLVGGNVRRG